MSGSIKSSNLVVISIIRVLTSVVSSFLHLCRPMGTYPESDFPTVGEFVSFPSAVHTSHSSLRKHPRLISLCAV